MSLTPARPSSLVNRQLSWCPAQRAHSIAMTYLADHLPPEAIQSVLAEGLKTRLAATPSELVHMGNAPTISPAPHPTEITDESTYSDDVQIQMPQTGWGGTEFGAFATPLLESPRDAAPPPLQEP